VIKNEKWLMRRDPFSRLIGWTQRVGFKLTKNSFRKHFIIDRERCKLCGLCINFCPVKNLKLEKSEDKEMITYGSDCIFCLRCFNNCPQNAILFYEKTKDTKKYRRFRDQIPNFKLKYVKN
ncbi:MAG: 4Fe-4S dicluster domain-containing protein, partial [Promethearchaeota archaeon]